MEKITNISRNLKEFFNTTAEAISITTGFVKRKRKLTGSAFIKTMVFGNIGDGNCSIDAMRQLLSEDSVDITKQGLDFRFTQKAVDFMESMYKKSLSMFKSKLQIACPCLGQFESVKLLDSTYITLPETMKDTYKGYGSSYQGFESKTKSGIKIQLLFDYLNQSLDRLDIKEGVRSDQGYNDYLQEIKSNDLFIADLGYFVPASFKTIDKNGAYFISRYKADTNLYDADTKQKIDLVAELAEKNSLERMVLLGKEAQIKVRLICKELTVEQSAGRRRKANKLAKSHGYESSQKNQRLLDWSIFITNTGQNILSADQIISIYKVRWQIELLFKLYKSHVRIENLKGRSKSYRVLCELYAKLCVILLFHAMISLVSLKQDTEISLTKAMIELKMRAREFVLLLKQSTKNIRSFLETITTAWAKFSLKDKRRKKRVSTLTLLNSIATQSLT